MHGCRKILRTAAVFCTTMSTVGDSFIDVEDEISHNVNHFI